MEEECPSFELNFEFLEPDVEQENKTDQHETDKEVEEFIKEQRNPKTVKKTELQEVFGIRTKEIFRNKKPDRHTT